MYEYSVIQGALSLSHQIIPDEQEAGKLKKQKSGLGKNGVAGSLLCFLNINT